MSVVPLRRLIAILLLSQLLPVTFVAAENAAYPDRPITMVVTFAAGGSSDVLARAAADALSKGLGQPVIVDNRPGAGGHIGAEAVAHAAPDGYTILFGTNGTLGIGPALYKNLRYDPEHDLAPVGLLHKLPLLLIVNPSVPAKNLTELIDYAKHNPGAISFASAGVGSASHLAGELFKEQANIDILHVPYKGGGAAVTDLISGRVQMMIETIPNALPLVRNGQMRAIGVTTKERSKLAPDITSLAESGLPDFDISAWTGLFAPAGTPPAIVDRLNAETQKIAGDKDYVARIEAMGTDVSSSGPQAFGKFVGDDVNRWNAVIHHAGIAQIE
ncbi:MAG TPA: tripartite tricarboxylate transporter substrate binding protein [Xanthobacteraceae bacterium]|jgi:tripartite-type tricarboxylate transporter receptor subunit TctC|nr:tripartite tricarboxylate transporter substrate binding protein [Xanthobacteraceae bacterium]